MNCVNSIRVSPCCITLEAGTWYYDVSVEVSPSDADCTAVTWHSDNPSVASVNASSGYIYAGSVGTARVYATATDGSGCSDYITVTVSGTIPVESIALNYSTVSVEKGNSITLAATVTPENASNPLIDWSSSNNSVATVNDGVVTALSQGTAIITATACDGSEVSASCTVTVTEDILVTSIEVEPVTSVAEYDGAILLPVGKSIFLQATVHPKNATNPNVMWKSNNSCAVTVNQDNGGVFAKSEGIVTVYAMALDKSRVSGSRTIRMIIPAESVDVDLSYKTLAPNETVDLSATVGPTNASIKSVRWSSDNPTVATVNANGVVTAKTDGLATITAEAKDGSDCSDTCTIRVDSRDGVIVESESNSNYSRIVFSNGKVWNCINLDLINDYSLNVNDPFSQRFYDNTYQTKVVDNGNVYYYAPMKEYSDEEIKLIYTIDPHGLAAYVQEYASQLFNAGTSVQDGLERLLGYKDRIFYLLFNRNPKYYARNISGTWYETNDKSDLTKVLSESEFLFGKHQVYDIVTLSAFISVVIDIVSMVIQCPGLKSINVVSKIGKVIGYYSLGRSVAKSVLNGDFNGFISAIVDGLVDEDDLGEDLVTPANYKTQNYTLGWAHQLLSFSSDLEALADTFENGPHFYKEVFTQCNNDLNYNILIRTTDNVLVSLADINRAIS